MSKRRAIVLLVVLGIFIFALLSVAAYTVKTQELQNATDALTGHEPTAATQITPDTSVTPPVPVVQNDAVDTDKSSLQYKVVSGKGFTVEVPLQWNTLTETIGACTTQTIINGTVRVDIWPATCSIPGTYTQSTDVEGYTIASNYTDEDIVSKAVYKHILATFTIAQ